MAILFNLNGVKMSKKTRLGDTLIHQLRSEAERFKKQQQSIVTDLSKHPQIQGELKKMH